MIPRREVAQRLDIPLEMARRHGLPTRMTEAELRELEATPPAWLVQSRANRGSKAVWVQLTCDICGATESARPKKWWPAFSYVSCAVHPPDDLPEVPAGVVRREYDNVGTRFVGIVDEPQGP
ncbi:DUF5997 family protein [Planctomonas psychrotolerans]|uniref:DUF5997 family protein n=1 Tax=Planctomonas psychrotolerans TaxID=2528712 RepID=UPI00123B4D4F|nr:DUF5997 family protein [Planctomonas psychrotolerans]